MKGIEAHFCGRLSRDAEQRTTKAGKPMTVLQVVVPDQDADTWCTVLAFEGLAERLAGLAKGTEVYCKGKLKAGLYHPEGGEPRVSLTLLASHVEPLVLERKRTARPAASGVRREPAQWIRFDRRSRSVRALRRRSLKTTAFAMMHHHHARVHGPKAGTDCDARPLTPNAYIALT